MIRNDLNDLSDAEFEKIVIPFDRSVKKFVKDTFLNYYIAYYISESYKQEVLWEQKYFQLINSALEQLTQFRYYDCNFNEIKRILQKDYNLKILNNSPKELLRIKEL